MALFSRLYGRVLDALFIAACVMLFAMMAIICADVILRNVGLGGVGWANEVSENLLYLLTLFSAPWLLRQGQHIRVDILLRALPARIGWALEWLNDLAGLACCLYFIVYGLRVTASSYESGAMSIKTLITPEWWMLAPLPVAFALVAIEFLFRMHRLQTGPREPRGDAVSAA